VTRRYVYSRNLENEEDKNLYRAVKIQPQWLVTPEKQTTTNNVPLYSYTTPVRTMEFMFTIFPYVEQFSAVS